MAGTPHGPTVVEWLVAAGAVAIALTLLAIAPSHAPPAPDRADICAAAPCPAPSGTAAR